MELRPIVSKCIASTFARAGESKAPSRLKPRMSEDFRHRKNEFNGRMEFGDTTAMWQP